MALQAVLESLSPLEFGSRRLAELSQHGASASAGIAGVIVTPPGSTMQAAHPARQHDTSPPEVEQSEGCTGMQSRRRKGGAARAAPMQKAERIELPALVHPDRARAGSVGRARPANRAARFRPHRSWAYGAFRPRRRLCRRSSATRGGTEAPPLRQLFDLRPSGLRTCQPAASAAAIQASTSARLSAIHSPTACAISASVYSPWSCSTTGIATCTLGYGRAICPHRQLVEDGLATVTNSPLDIVPDHRFFRPLPTISPKMSPAGGAVRSRPLW